MNKKQQQKMNQTMSCTADGEQKSQVVVNTGEHPTDATQSAFTKTNTATKKKQNEITNTLDTPSTLHCIPRDPASNTTHQRTGSDKITGANGTTAITAALEFFTTIFPSCPSSS